MIEYNNILEKIEENNKSIKNRLNYGLLSSFSVSSSSLSFSSSSVSSSSLSSSSSSMSSSSDSSTSYSSSVSDDELIKLYDMYVIRYGAKMGLILLKALGVVRVEDLTPNKRLDFVEALESISVVNRMVDFGKSGIRNLDI